ncbi:EAL domain-containing protein [Pseudomonas zhanjiangensis]|uniref:EAL domain-containing protein n=1 Tax=Pseudomonas zhanjiangensis TaxID=3239015 RepID=A0ABV3YYL5_9PSED
MSASTPLRILLIDDDEDDYLITRELLQEAEQLHCQLDWISNYDAGRQALHRQEYDLYLIDYRIDADIGLDLIADAQCQRLNAPMILLTGQGDQALDAHAVEMGAADYLIKGQFDGQVLGRSIRYALSRAQTTAALSASEYRYRLLFDANPNPVYVFHRDTMRILEVNEAMMQLYGYSRDELLDMTVVQLRPSAHQEYFLQQYRSFLAEARISEVEIWTHRTRTDQEIQVEIQWHTLDYDGLPAILVLVNDVTEKLKARQESERKERAFRQLLSDSRDGILVVDHEDRVHYANPAAEALLEAPLSQLRDHRLHLPEEPCSQCDWSIALESGQALEVEIQCAQTEWDGQPMRLLSLRDVRARKESEKQLHLLGRCLDATDSGIMICDAQAKDVPIIYVNPAFERITGYSADESIGRNPRFLHGGESDQTGIDDIRRAIQGKREVHAVVRDYRKDGSPFWNSLYISPVPDRKGTITHFIGVQSDISEQKRFESQLAYNASHDVLTGLPNRSLLTDRLNQGYQISQRYNRSLAVMFIDLDGFKPINDSLGHEVGDKILIQVAQRLSQQVRPGDTVARLGGDEFIVILPDLAHEEDVVLVADRIIDSIATPYGVDNVELHITASIGISLSSSNMQIGRPDQLILQADLAMQIAKKQGRNNYQWYTRDLEQKVGERVNLRIQLQKAIETEAMNLHYQPQFDGLSGRVVGYEALLRWQHPELGHISPLQFIPLAEDTGQIIPLSEWVLKTACRDARSLLDQGFKGALMAVNISPVQFQRSNFVERVRTILEQTGLPAEMLELEITETVLVDNPERAVDTIQRLKQLGVCLAIDDFGTGFSSLNYLKRLPIDKVKIDRSFVQDIISNQHDAAISQGIISMAHHLKLKVIAEGVETEAQFSFLKKSRCEEFQGYFFAKPMPLEQLEQFLQQQSKNLAKPLEKSEGNGSQTLLLLDDEENIMRALTRVLRPEGYRILTANNAQDAFALLAKSDVHVIISDQRMPEMSGTEFFSRVKSLYPQTIRIVLSGYTDLKSVTDAINQGAIYKFLTKPWDDMQLRATVAQAFQHHRQASADKEDAEKD